MNKIISLTGLLFIWGCAAGSSRYLAPGTDDKVFRVRPIVLNPEEPLIPVVGVVNEYGSFAKDGISDSAFRAKVRKSYFDVLNAKPEGAPIHLQSEPLSNDREDTIRFESGEMKIAIETRTLGKDSGNLRLLLGPVIYTRQVDLVTISMTSSRWVPRLVATQTWIIYDPVAGKALAGGRLSTSSNTFALITNIITQSDWFADARQLAEGLNQAVGSLR